MASSYIDQSDTSNVEIPKPFTYDGVRYTVTALQGMSDQHIDPDFVHQTIHDHFSELRDSNSLLIGHIQMLFRRNANNDIELSSVWKR